MSPRGQAIPDVRDRLFRAAERVLIAQGPGAVTARTVAHEAGVASGVLYNHFEHLDEFLAELVVDRFRVQAEQASGLPELAGTRTVADNLMQVAVQLLESPTLAVAELVRSRMELTSLVTTRLNEGAPGMPEVQGAIVHYLEAEQALGRVSAEADTQAAALMLVGAMHHLLLLHGAEIPDPHEAAQRVAKTLVTGI